MNMIQRIFRSSILYDARWDIVECIFYKANGITQITIPDRVLWQVYP